jgi:hypothetical protein
VSSPALTKRILSLDDGTPNNRYSLNISGGGLGAAGWVIMDGGVSQCSILSVAVLTSNVMAKLAASAGSNSFRLSKDAAAAVTDTSGSVPTGTPPTIFRVGSGEDNASSLFGHVAEFSIWPNLDTTSAEVQRLAT